jgi:hypothetical protein
MSHRSEESLRAKLARAEALALKKKGQGEALNQQIQAAERAIQQLELKVSASVGLPQTEGEAEDGVSRFLKFGRDGKTWRLLLVIGAHGEDPDENALVNATLRSKLDAIEALPALLDKLLDTAEEQVDEVNEHIDAAAKFTAELRKGR